jgi:hypothetical protein
MKAFQPVCIHPPCHCLPEFACGRLITLHKRLVGTKTVGAALNPMDSSWDCFFRCPSASFYGASSSGFYMPFYFDLASHALFQQFFEALDERYPE